MLKAKILRRILIYRYNRLSRHMAEMSYGLNSPEFVLAALEIIPSYLLMQYKSDKAGHYLTEIGYESIHHFAKEFSVFTDLIVKGEQLSRIINLEELKKERKISDILLNDTGDIIDPVTAVEIMVVLLRSHTLALRRVDLPDEMVSYYRRRLSQHYIHTRILMEALVDLAFV